MTTIPSTKVLLARLDKNLKERPDRFTFSKGLDSGCTVYSAQHELHNSVDITFPAGYWGDTDLHPLWIDMDFDITWPEYREPPLDDVVKELQRRLPNLMVENMYPGFLGVHVPGKGLLACGGDSDGWRIEHQDLTTGHDLDIPTLGTSLTTYCQDVNEIVTELMYWFTKSPWSDVIFTHTANIKRLL